MFKIFKNTLILNFYLKAEKINPTVYGKIDAYRMLIQISMNPFEDFLFQIHS